MYGTLRITLLRLGKEIPKLILSVDFSSKI